MKKILSICMMFIMLTTSIYAAEGEMGSFGGVSTGIPFETWTSMAQTNKKKTTTSTMPYKEVVYLSGVPEEVSGTIKVKQGTGIDKTKGTGKYTETYTVNAKNTTGTNVYRSITFTTEYVYDAQLKQTTRTSKVTKWTEVVTVGGQSYQLDDDQSIYTKSVVEEYTPGVTYYRGDINYSAVYTTGNQDDGVVTVTVNGPIYGYDQAFAKSETQRRTITIDLGGGKGYAVEETPTYTVYRDIQYGANEPMAISMAGNYKEFIRSEGSLSYNILQGSNKLEDDKKSGMIGVESTPVVEQLSVPTALNVANHPAESEIRKMYSMKVFTDDASKFSPNKVITKQEYIAMLVRTLQIPLPEEKKKTSKKAQQEVSPFTDIKEDNPYYKYAVAAYNAGLIDGGQFAGGTYMTREYLYTLNVKAIGLQRLGIGTMETYTPFVDDNSISSWAKASVYAASKIGLITSANGYVFPKKTVTEAECAAFLDQLISYLRYDLQKDYNDKMLIG